MGLLDNNQGPNSSARALLANEPNVAKLNSGALPLYSKLPPAVDHLGVWAYTSDQGMVFSNGVSWIPSSTGPAASLASLSPATSTQQFATTNQSFSANTPLTLANVTSGPGVVTRIWLTQANPGQMGQGHIQVYVDGEAAPSLDIEIQALIGLKLLFNLPGNAMTGGTQNFEYGIASSAGASWTLKYPIPFMSSVKVYYCNPAYASGSAGNLYAQVAVQFGINSPRRLRNVGAFSPYDNAPAYNGGTTYPIGAYVSSGSNNYIAIASTTGNSPTNTNFWAVSSAASLGSVSGTNLGNGTTVLAQVQNQPLWVVGLGLTGASGNATWMENAPMIYDVASGSPTTGTATYASSGFEDFCDSAFYFASHMCYEGGVSNSGSGLARSTISPSSGTAYRNLDQGGQTIVVSGGTVSAVQVSRDGSTYDTVASATGCSVHLAVGDYIKVTYSVAPTMAVYPDRGAATTTNTNTLLVQNMWDPAGTVTSSPSPQYIGIFKDLLALNGGIRCQNGLLMRFELPSGKSGPQGAGTQFGWTVLYYV